MSKKFGFSILFLAVNLTSTVCQSTLKWPARKLIIKNDPIQFVNRVVTRCLSTKSSDVEVEEDNSVLISDSPSCVSEMQKAAQLWDKNGFGVFEVVELNSAKKKMLRAKFKKESSRVPPDKLKILTPTLECPCLIVTGTERLELGPKIKQWAFDPDEDRK